jgi:hypothetical protein
MSELVTRPIEVISPATGEFISLDSPTEKLGECLADIRDYESLLREAKRALTTELLARFDRNAQWTVHAGGFKLSGQSPAPVEEWDGAELRTALLGLVDADLLSIEAVDAAVETVVTYKPRKAGINALKKLGGRVGEVVESLRQESERERRITVSRA